MSAENRYIPGKMKGARGRTGPKGGPGRGPAGGPGGGHGPGGIGRPAEKPRDFKGALKRLLGYLKPFRVNLVIVFICAIASTVFAIASPRVQSKAVNKLTDGYMARTMLNEMTKIQKQAVESINEQMKSLISGPGAVPGGQQPGAGSQPSGTEQGAGSAGQGTAGANGPAYQMTPEEMEAIREFLALPMLDEVGESGQKADIVAKMMALGEKMSFTRQAREDANQGGEQSEEQDAEQAMQPGKFTQEQMDDGVRAIRETGGKIDYYYILQIIAILIAVYILSSSFQFITQWVMSTVAQRTSYQLRKDVDAKLARLPLRYYDSKTHGEILSRVTNDVDSISNTLQQSITQMITAMIQIAGYIVMMLVTSPILTLIVLATMPLYILTTAFAAKKSQKYFASQQKELGELSGHVEEMYGGHKVIKAFGHEGESIEEFESVNDRLYEAGWKAQFVSGVMFPLMNFISNIGYVLICVFGGIWMTRNRLRLGDIIAFIQYSKSFTHPIVQTANIANIIQSTVACAERVFEVLDEEEEAPDAADAVTPEYPRGDVLFDHVDFSYAESEPLITNMNLSLRRGDTIAVVGPTGAGKTTLVNLLMRFYEIDKGSIMIDGTDIRNIRRNALRGMFGMVLQDTWLFNGTIRDNIAYGRQGASEEDVVRAAAAAHADYFIRTLPDGYDTVLNEEATNISQGQKQLLTIARAILADPAILILDEATSSVDTRTELLIQKAMANLMKGRTSFVIAHRLSTIRDAELILVMNHGAIIEQGGHKELLAKGGFYADLYNSQFTGANPDSEAV